MTSIREASFDRSARGKAGRVEPAYIRRLAIDLGMTVVLLALVIWGALEIQPYISGKHGPSPALVVFLALMPILNLVALSAIERLFTPAGPRKSLQSWLLHLHITIFYVFMSGIATALALVGSTALVRWLGIGMGLIRLDLGSGHGWLMLLGGLWLASIIGDFFFYWFHRALHRSPFLWQHHKMHHMDPELEAITVVRQNWIEVFFAAVFIGLPTALLFKTDQVDLAGMGLMTWIMATVFTTILQIGHANVRWQVGRASVLWCSPQMHRIHHSLQPEHIDKNFAFTLPLWDVLFGTYYAPKRDEFPETGVHGETEISSFWESQIFTQREWWKMYRAWRASKATKSRA